MTLATVTLGLIQVGVLNQQIHINQQMYKLTNIYKSTNVPLQLKILGTIDMSIIMF